MPRPRSTPVRSIVAVVPPAAANPLHQPSLQQPPPPSLKAHSKHQKLVRFKPQQSNIQANQDLWDVVNRHIDQFNKARLSPHEGTSNAYEEPPRSFLFSYGVGLWGLCRN
ncbi:uncharacterized protein A4U43_C05F23480 [Asparagus officinalis]|uniref:Uncharacterized protein n=1 Tax=Asparagus officinalis TaxID=4686 RepID=A0A5P1EY79_ASPOF|nr:uncharacterized protein A4U43_C05F23480 [Asparagus officinalis]